MYKTIAELSQFLLDKYELEDNYIRFIAIISIYLLIIASRLSAA